MKKKPQRMCVSCRLKTDKSNLIRIVLLPTGEVEVDFSGKKPGRGAYICSDSSCLVQAIKNHRFEKGLKTQINASHVEELKNQVQQYYTKLKIKED